MKMSLGRAVSPWIWASIGAAFVVACGVSDRKVTEDLGSSTGGAGTGGSPAGGGGSTGGVGTGGSLTDGGGGTSTGGSLTDGGGGTSTGGSLTDGGGDSGTGGTGTGGTGTGGAPPTCDPGAPIVVEPSLAKSGDTVTIEGTFCGATTVTFPGASPVTATVLGTHRATATVPTSATAGALSVTTGGNTSLSTPFRRTTLTLGLQQFQQFDDQTYVPKRMPKLLAQRLLPASAVAGGYVHVMGGVGLNTVDEARINADGSIGPFQAGTPLTIERNAAATVVVGDYLYMVGGCTGSTPNATVERSRILTTGLLESFSVVSGASLLTARCRHTVNVVGNSLVVVGGVNGSNVDVTTVERAPIASDGSLGSFQVVSGVSLDTARHDHTSLVSGPYLYVIGGDSVGNGVQSSVERASIAGDGTLGDFATVTGVNLVAARSGSGLVAVGSSVYAIGGAAAGGTAVASVERATIASDGSLGTFATLAGVSLPAPRDAFATMLTGNFVHVMGGGDGVTGFATSMRASIVASPTIDTTVVTTQAFTGIASLDTPVLIGDTFHAVGGSSTGTRVEHASLSPNGALGAFAANAAGLTHDLSRHVGFMGGNYAYVAGGNNGTSNAVTTVERATVSPDGSMTGFTAVGNTVLSRASGGAAVVGDYVYILGGFYGGTATSVERATIAADGSLGSFATVAGVALSVARTTFSTLVLGKYLYAVGGRDASDVNRLASIDRVALNDDGTLNGNFAATVSFVNARHQPPLVIAGGYLYALGGDTGQTIERAPINADGTLGAFAVVPSLTFPGVGWPVFVAGDFLTASGAPQALQMRLQ